MKHAISPLLSPIYALTEQWFSISLEQYVEQLNEALIEKAESSNSVSMQSNCFAALHNIKSKQNEAVKLFFASLGKHFCTSNNYPGLFDNSPGLPLKKYKLNLIATKDLEENLSFINAKDKLNKQNKEAFEHLEIRIFELLKNSDETLAKSPLNAENILNAFRDSVDVINFSPDLRIVAYKYFEQYLSQNIAQLLETLNKKLIAQGILPSIETDYCIKKQPKTSSSTEKNEPVATEQTVTETNVQKIKSAIPDAADQLPAANIPMPQTTNQQSSTMTGAPTSPSEAQTSALNSRLLELARQITQSRGQTQQIADASNAHQDASSPASSASTQSQQPLQNNTIIDSPLMQQPTGNISTHKGQHSLGHLINSSATPQASLNNNPLLSLEQQYAQKNNNISNLISSNMVNQHRVSTTELVSALKSIQSFLISEDTGSQSSAQSIRAQLKENILAPTNKSFNSTELNHNKLYLVDMIEDIFDNISQNKELSTTGFNLLKRLTVPVMQLTLVDENFIADKQHPARAFLDDFSNATLGIIDTQEKQHDAFYLKLSDIAARLNSEENIDSAVFKESHKQLNHFIARRKQQANTRSHASKSAIEAKIDAILDYCIKGKQLPDGIVVILKRIWKNVMLDIYSDSNCTEDDKEKATAFINSLIFSIKPAQSAIDKQRLEKIIPIINEELEDGLIRINYPYTTKTKVSQYLHKFHTLALGTGPATKIQTGDNNDDLHHAITANQEIETRLIKDELISVDNHINKKQSEKVTDSLEEAFIAPQKTDNSTTQESLKHTLEHINTAPPSIERPEKQSKTDFELIRLVNNSYKMSLVNDEYTQQTKQLGEDSWLEFRFAERYSRARITWIGDDHSQFNCLTENNRVINMTLEALSDSLRKGIGNIIHSSSIIDDAITSLHDNTPSEQSAK